MSNTWEIQRWTPETRHYDTVQTLPSFYLAWPAFEACTIAPGDYKRLRCNGKPIRTEKCSPKPRVDTLF